MWVVCLAMLFASSVEEIRSLKDVPELEVSLQEILLDMQKEEAAFKQEECVSQAED